MSNMKRRKRLNALALVFLLVFLAGAAFAFVPGMLDVTGRVGLREASYVQWVLAATQHSGIADRALTAAAPHPSAAHLAANPLDPDNVNPVRLGFTHDRVPSIASGGNRVAAVHRTTDISHLPVNSPVYLSHARIVTGDSVRERESQRIEWSVIFTAAGTARLYVQALNTCDLSYVEITEARVVSLTDVGVIAPLLADDEGWMGDGLVPTTLAPPALVPPGYQGLPGRHILPVVSAGLNNINLASGLDQMFTIGGTYSDLEGVLTPFPNTGVGAANINSFTEIEHIELTWNGNLEVLAGEIGATTWTWVDDAVDEPGVAGRLAWLEANLDPADPAWDDIDWIENPPTGRWVNAATGDWAVEYLAGNRDNPRGYGITLLPSNAIAGEIFMTTFDTQTIANPEFDPVTNPDVPATIEVDIPRPLGELSGWVGTFVIELDYELTSAP